MKKDIEEGCSEGTDKIEGPKKDRYKDSRKKNVSMQAT